MSFAALTTSGAGISTPPPWSCPGTTPGSPGLDEGRLNGDGARAAERVAEGVPPPVPGQGHQRRRQRLPQVESTVAYELKKLGLSEVRAENGRVLCQGPLHREAPLPGDEVLPGKGRAALKQLLKGAGREAAQAQQHPRPEAKQAHRQKQGDLHPHGPAQQRGNQGHQRPGGEPDGGEPHGDGLAGRENDQNFLKNPLTLHLVEGVV